MSLKLMVRVMEEIDVTRPQQLVLLSMAENAKDDGSRCFPSVDLIAWKAGYKPRAVIDIMRDLRQMGVLEIVAEHRAQRATEYHIHLDKAPQKPTFDEWQAEHGRHKQSVRRGAISRVSNNDEGCNLTSREVQSHVRGVQSHVKNTRENAPEPSGNRKEPSENHDGKKPSRATHVPDIFPITDALITWGEKHGFSTWQMESQVELFQDHYRSKGETRKDWVASFRTWMHKARSWGHLPDDNGIRRKADSKGGMVWG